MATRTPLREYKHHRVEPSHGLLHRAEEWAEETGGFAPEGGPAEGVPWHAVLLILLGLGLLIGVEIALAFGIAKLVTGHAYQVIGVLLAAVAVVALMLLAGLVERGYLTRLWRRGATPSSRPRAHGSQYEDE